MATASSDQTQQVRDVLIEAARVQLAAMTSVIRFWSGWAQSAEKYSQSISDELAQMSEGGQRSETAVSKLGDLTREYLRELAKLPVTAADQFSSEIEKLSATRTKRTPKRAARVKR